MDRITELGIQHFNRFVAEAKTSAIPKEYIAAMEVLGNDDVDREALSVALTGRRYRERLTEYAIIYGLAIARVKAFGWATKAIEALLKEDDERAARVRKVMPGIPQDVLDLTLSYARESDESQLREVKRMKISIATDCGSALLLEERLTPQEAEQVRIDLNQVYSDPRQRDYILSLAKERDDPF